MSYYEDPEPQAFKDSPQYREELAAAEARGRAAGLAEHGIAERPSEEVISAEIAAAGTEAEVSAVLRKYGMLRSELG